MVVPFGWRAPSCLTPAQALKIKGMIYPISTHYIRCIWGWFFRVPSQGFSHRFPYDWVCASVPVKHKFPTKLFKTLRSLRATKRTGGFSRLNGGLPTESCVYHLTIWRYNFLLGALLVSLPLSRLTLETCLTTPPKINMEPGNDGFQ